MSKRLSLFLLMLSIVFMSCKGFAFAAEDGLTADEADPGYEEDETAGVVDGAEEEAADTEEETADTEVECGYEILMVEGEAVPVVFAKKFDVSVFFTEITGEKKYELSNKKLASVSKKGIVTVKKPGRLVVDCYLKEEGKWVQKGSRSFELTIPKAAKKSIAAGIYYKTGQTIDLKDGIVDNLGIPPTKWSIKCKADVAYYDADTGTISVGNKNGTLTVNAEYGGGDFKRVIPIKVKIDHKTIDVSSQFEIPEGAQTRYTISDKKIASISKKGVIKFKKEGNVTVNIQFKEGKTWIYKDTHARSYNMKKVSGVPLIEEGLFEHGIDEKGSYTSKGDVSYYIHVYEKLPDNFITKKEAQDLGWPGGGLDRYADGKCIGGDKYSNYEGTLPEGDYRECDIDTLHKSKRGAKRLVYDVSDGDIYYTADHYKNFIQLY